MFPYFDTTPWQVGPFNVQAFVLTLGLSVTAGWLITASRAARYSISRQRASELATWMLVVGFVGTYVFAMAYVPGALSQVIHHPTRIFTAPAGLASFGGFAGGLIGAATFFRVRKVTRQERLAFLESVGFAIPFAWSIGRFGCYLVHDHPGIRTTSWLGVRYPGGTRFDLGLLEVLFLVALGLIFILLDRKPRPLGFFRIALFLPYGVFRLLEDHLRIDPQRYFGWTVDEIAATLMIVLTLVSLASLQRSRISTWFRFVTSDAG